MARIIGTTGSSPPATKPKKPRVPKYTGPKSEVAAGSGYGLKKAATFKGDNLARPDVSPKNEAYRGAVRAAYKSLPTKARSAQSAAAELKAGLLDAFLPHDSGPKIGRGGLSLEQYVPLREHVLNLQRNQVLSDDAAKFAGLSGDDRRRVDEFMAGPHILASQEVDYTKAQHTPNVKMAPSSQHGGHVYDVQLLDPKSGKITRGFFNPGQVVKGPNGERQVVGRQFDVPHSTWQDFEPFLAAPLKLGFAGINALGKVIHIGSHSGAGGLQPGKPAFEGVPTPAFVQQASDVAKRGLLAGGSGFVKGLNIPGAAVRSQEGLALGLGPNATSQDIAQHFGLPRQLGIINDIASDPVMWAGIGLAPETGGESLAATLSRIKTIAPEILDSGKGKAILDSLAKHGDEKTALKDLTKLISKTSVKGKLLRGRTPLQEALRRRSVANIEEALAKSPSEYLNVERARLNPKRLLGHGDTYQRKVRMPGKEAIESIKQQQQAALVRQVAAKPQLRVVLPTGRRTRFNLTLPLDISRVPAPIRQSKAAYKLALAEAKVATKTHSEEAYASEIERLNKAITSARRKKQPDLARRLQAQQSSLADEHAARLTEAISNTESEFGGRKLLSIGDLVAARNARAAMHAGHLGADEYRRTVEGITNRAVDQATGKLTPRESARVHAYMETQSSAGAAVHELPFKLTTKEQRAAANLRKIYDLQLNMYHSAGIMEEGRGIEGYAGTRAYEDPGRTLLAGGHGAAANTPLKGREAASFADISDPNRLAEELTRLADRPLSAVEARKIADSIFHQGNIRGHQELIARDIARNGPQPFEKYGPLGQHAINSGTERGLGGNPLAEHPEPVFITPHTNPEVAEGDVLLHPNVAGRFNSEALKNLPEPARRLKTLTGLVRDRQLVDRLILGHEANSAQEAAHELTGMRDELTAQIHAIDPALETKPRLGDTADNLKRGRIKGQHTRKLNAIQKQIDEHQTLLKGSGATEAAPATTTNIPVKGYNFKVVTGPEGPHVEVTTERAGRAYTAPDDAHEIADALNTNDYKDAAELRAELDRTVETHNEQTGTPATAEADAVDHAAEIAKLKKQQTAIKRQQSVALKAHDATVESRQTGGAVTPNEDANLTKEIDASGTLWLRTGSHADVPPHPSDTTSFAPPVHDQLPNSPWEPNRDDDPYDYVGTLPDFRAGGVLNSRSGAMLKLDAKHTGYLSSRSAGNAAGSFAKLKAISENVGRSSTEATKQTWHTADGSLKGDVKDLNWHFNDQGAVTHYTLKKGSSEIMDPRTIIEANDLRLDPKTLFVSHDKTSYTDPQGMNWYSPHLVLPDQPFIDKLPKDVLWPAPVIAEYKRQLRIMNGPGGEAYDHALYSAGVKGLFERTLAQIRFGVTTVFPAYHVRNMASDLIKSLQADSGVLFHPVANVKVTAAAFQHGLGWKMAVPGLGKMSMEDFLFVADLAGVRTGHHVAEVAQLMKDLGHGEPLSEGRVAKAFHNSWFVPGGKSTRFGAHREDVVRFQTFVQRLRANEGDVADAANYVMLHHFNYNDLGYHEKRFARNVFLFYTWYRKNIPLQLAELARRPGFFSALGNFERELSTGGTPFNVGPLSGAAPAQPFTPDYVFDQLGSITTNWKNHALNLAVGAPWADLSLVSEKGALDGVASLLNPAIQIPTQLIYRIDPLSKRRYANQEPSGIANIIAAMGYDLPKDVNGNPTLPWWINVVARNIPIAGRASYSGQSVPPSRDQGRLQSLIQQYSWLTGVTGYVAPAKGSGPYMKAEELAGKAAAAQYRQAVADLHNLPHGADLTNPKVTSPEYLKGVNDFKRQELEDWTRHFNGNKKEALRYLSGIRGSGFYLPSVRIPAPPRSGLSGGITSGVSGGVAGGVK